VKTALVMGRLGVGAEEARRSGSPTASGVVIARVVDSPSRVEVTRRAGSLGVALAGVVLSQRVVVSARSTRRRTPEGTTRVRRARPRAAHHGQLHRRLRPRRLPHTKYPPLFPALLALLIALGARTWVALKAAAAIATVVAVGLTYLWAERRGGTVAAGARRPPGRGFRRLRLLQPLDPLRPALRHAHDGRALALRERADRGRESGLGALVGAWLE
jgi:hypothetical protein